MRGLFCAVFLLLCVAACSDGSASGSPLSALPSGTSAPEVGGAGGTTGTASGVFSSAMHADVGAYCTALRTCFTPNDEYLLLRQLFADNNECVTFMERVLERAPFFRQALAFKASGALVYDAVLHSRVMEGLAACDLRMVGRLKDNPGTLFGWDGTGTVGASCTSKIDCQGSMVCVPVAPDACGGICQAPPGQGMPCSIEGECDQGAKLACNWQSNTCEAALEPGAPAAAGEPCDDPAVPGHRACVPGLYCFEGPPSGQDMTPGARTCQAPVAAGAPCYSGDQVCAEGGVCLATAPNATTKVCGKLLVLTTEGAPCDARVAAVGDRLCDATEGLACVGGTCKRSLDGGLNAPCFTGDITEELGCAPGFYCDTKTASPSCQPLKSTGVSCGDSGGWSCQGFCDLSSATAVPGSIIPDHVCADAPCASDTWN
ncbi:MAG: hypothetical protein SFV15_19025 [Polyangiaceae bacterium]|nr:hypothetical protein [Polyangiaceae bacterium]